MFKNFADEVPIIFMISALVYLLCFPFDPQTALETFLEFFLYVFVASFILRFIFERWL